MTETKFGIIGTGMISGMFCDALAEVPGASSCAVLSRSEETGKTFIARAFSPEEQKKVSVFTDFDEFLKSGINALYVATPNCLHKEYSIRAMESGLDVLCEKPIASDLGEFEEMVSVSEKTGRIILEAMRPAFDPGYDVLRDNIGKIGKIRRASFEYCQYSSRYDRFKSGEIPRAFDPSYSNAAVMDIGVYPIYVCSMLFGKPTEEIFSKSFVFENGMEGSGEVILPYGEMTAHISYAKICDSVNASVITGENGSITIDRLSSPRTIRLLLRDGTDQTLYVSHKDNNMNYEITEFLKLTGERTVKHKYSDYSAVSMGIIDTVRKQNGIVFSKRPGIV